ncbi:MAG: extracellular solute-binding protein [Caldilineaceae bacterium]|jgi:maltose-binding protein MalE
MRHLLCACKLVRTAIVLSLAVFLLLLPSACNRGDNQETGTAPPPGVTTAPTLTSDEPAVDLEMSTSESDTAQVDDAPVQVSLPTATPQPEPTPATGTLTLWHSWAQRDGDALGAILDSFHAAHPGVTIETLFVAQDDLLQSYAQAVADGSGPDIVLAPNWWLSDLQSAAAVAPLDEPAFERAMQNVWPSAIDNFRIDGRLYGMPISYETVALYYNRDLLSDGVVAFSLDDLLSGASENPQFGVGIYANPFHVAWGFPAFGATLFDNAGKAIFDENPGTVAFLQWLASVNALNGSFVDEDYGMLMDRFKRGEFAYFVDGPWSLPELTGALGDALGVAPIPPGPAGPSRPWLYADAAYVHPNLPDQQQGLVVLFLSYLTGKTSAATLAGVAGRLPANRSVDLSQYPLLNGFAMQAENATGMAHGPEMDAFWRYGGDMVVRAVAGAEDLNLVVTESAALTNETTGR